MDPYKLKKLESQTGTAPKKDFDSFSMMSQKQLLKIDYDYIVKHVCTQNPEILKLPAIQSFDQQKKYVQIIHIDLICVTKETDAIKALQNLPSIITVHSPNAQGCANHEGKITPLLEYATLKTFQQMDKYCMAMYSTRTTDMDKCSMKVATTNDIALEFFFQQPFKEKRKLWTQEPSEFIAQELILTLRIENEEDR